jgi:serine/threonine-protein phosphatase 2A regulatory subunit A
VLAEQLGRDFLSEKLGETCLNWLVDSVHTVRVSAAENIRRLFCLFGEDWLKDNIFPRLERMLVHSNYLHRMSALFTIQQLASLLSKSMVDSSVVPLLIQMSTDSVANIRMCVGRLILALASSPRPDIRQGLSRLAPTIAQLVADKDPDARLIAQKVAGMLR